MADATVAAQPGPVDLDEQARAHDAAASAAASAPPAAEERPAPSPSVTGAAIIASQLKTVLEQVATQVTDRTQKVRAQLDRIDAVMLDDAARIKSELDAYVIAAEALARQVDSMGTLTDDISSKRAKRVNGE